MKLTEYSLAFIFTSLFNEVLLITKNMPLWQKGKLNGLGGHIEKNESPIAAVEREVFEETNLQIHTNEWMKVGMLSGIDWKVHVFATIYTGKQSDAQTMTDEKIDWYKINNLPKNIISNLSWLIPLSIDILKYKEIKKISIYY